MYEFTGRLWPVGKTLTPHTSKVIIDQKWTTSEVSLLLDASTRPESTRAIHRTHTRHAGVGQRIGDVVCDHARRNGAIP